MNMIPRLFAAAGAVVLWAYARACRERNATQRRLARANLLRRVTARPSRCHDCGRADGGCDRVITVDIPAEDRDPHLAEKLRLEADAILAWARLRRTGTP